eukprot:TRINITY_DN12791_c0_g1_i1.p1 TRINITY_DN12791_c0_g1~~TRINITY_DN12791_c0_g1_i1.p1  ORF type:complete len:305 (-),score=29.57 TRINITY_DN12791_c0_g1_i1:64-903(-)
MSFNINQSPEMRGDNRVGYWGPPTSSIDWCEANYVWSFYIAEFWNTLSSFTLAFWSIISLVLAIRQGLEMRVYVGNLLVILVGLGSVAFHATLLYDLQMWDEIPMVWLILSWYYALWNLTVPIREKNYLVVIMLVAYGILWALVHYAGAYTVAFQLHFAFIAVLAGIKLVYIWWFKAENARQFGYMIPLFLIAITLALVSWVVDQTMCDQINTKLPFNPQLHAVWHFLCSITLHFGVQYTTALRMIFLGQKPITKKVAGMPFVVSSIKWDATAAEKTAN